MPYRVILNEALEAWRAAERQREAASTEGERAHLAAVVDAARRAYLAVAQLALRTSPGVEAAAGASEVREAEADMGAASARRS